MERHPQIYRFVWQGIEIEATYTPPKWSVIAHLEIRSMRPERSRLPITAIGYRSLFHQPGTIESRGGDVVALLTAWLDESAAKPAWRAYVEVNKQGALF